MQTETNTRVIQINIFHHGVRIPESPSRWRGVVQNELDIPREKSSLRMQSSKRDALTSVYQHGMFVVIFGNRTEKAELLFL